MYINKKHIKVIPLLICFFYSFFNNNYLFSQDIEKDTIYSDTLKNKLILDDVRRKAKGYIKINNKEKIITLFDNAELYYMDIELRSGIIKFDWETNVVSAGRIKDSLGNYIQSPIFKQGGDEINPDSLRYNFDTKKALIWNSRTTQNEMNVFSSATKKENDSIYFIKEAKVTTSKNLDDPEYYIRVRSGKFIPKIKLLLVQVTYIFMMYQHQFFFHLPIFL